MVISSHKYLIRSRYVLYERLEQIFSQNLTVAAEDATPELLVSDVFEGAAQQDGEVLSGLRVEHLQLFRFLFA
jgi:hypothetical protein